MPEDLNPVKQELGVSGYLDRDLTMASNGRGELTVAVKTICAEHLALGTGERLLVVADPPKRELAREIAELACSLGYHASLKEVGLVRSAGSEPGGFTAEALLSAQAALLVTSKSLSHTPQRRAACLAGVRIASMPSITGDMLRRLFLPGAHELADSTMRAAAALEGAAQVRVRTVKGTDLEFSLQGRRIYPDTGLYHRPGSFGNLPAGEVAAAPRSGSARGVVVVDVAFAGLGKVKELVLEIDQGKLRGASGDGSGRVLEILGTPRRKVVAEFGIGTNPRACPGPVTLEAEKALGTVHLGFGDSRSFGGENEADGHWDAVLSCGVIEVDGRSFTARDYHTLTGCRIQ